MSSPKTMKMPGWFDLGPSVAEVEAASSVFMLEMRRHADDIRRGSMMLETALHCACASASTPGS